MKRKSASLYLGKIAGTALYIHWSFLLLIFYVYYSSYKEEGSLQQGLFSMLFLLAVFACITLHELGHIVVARRYGSPARSITLFPFGGIAQIEKMPEKPIHEFWMALAGPWVNVIIASVIFLVISLSSGMPEFGPLQALDQNSFLYNLMVVNITLAIFNLIPAFPMDGGRVLRAVLAMFIPRLRATRIAARIGQVIAIGFIILGIVANWWLILIGLVIIIGASGEAMLEMNRSAMANHKVSDVVMHQYTLLHMDDTLEKVMQVMLDSHEKDFIVDAGDGTYGSLTGAEIVAGLQTHGKNITVGQIMNRNAPALNENMSLDDAFHKMTINDLTVCPVVRDNNLIGILDLPNINEFIAFELARTESLGKRFAVK